MKAILPCAGYGTRLSKEISNGLPKHLLPVCGQPVIEYTLMQLDAMSEVDKVFIVTNDIFYNQFDEYLNRSRFGSKVVLVNNRSTSNENRLGTVGDITAILEEGRFSDDVMVILADNLYDFRLDKAVITFSSFTPRIPLVVSYNMGNKERVRGKYGVLSHDETMCITRFEEKPESPESALASTGIYIFPRGAIQSFIDYTREANGDLKKLDRMGDFVGALVKSGKVATYVYSSEKYKWLDIGTKETYDEAQRVWANKAT